MPQDFGEKRQGDGFMKSSSSISHPSFLNDGGESVGGLGYHGHADSYDLALKESQWCAADPLPLPRLCHGAPAFPSPGMCWAKCILCCMAGCVASGCASERWFTRRGEDWGETRHM